MGHIDKNYPSEAAAREAALQLKAELTEMADRYGLHAMTVCVSFRCGIGADGHHMCITLQNVGGCVNCAAVALTDVALETSPDFRRAFVDVLGERLARAGALMILSPDRTDTD